LIRLGVAILLSTLPMLAQQDGPFLLKQAQSDLSAGRYSLAVRDGTAALEWFRRSNLDQGQIRSLTVVGLAQMYSGAYTDALNNFTSARDLASRTHDLEYQITSLNNIGTVQYFVGRYSEAMEAYRSARALVDAAPPAKWLSSRRQLTSANTAILLQTLGQYDRALDIYNDVLKSHGALPPQEEAQLLANIGVLRRRLGDPQKALDTYRAAQLLYRKAGHRDGEIAVLNNIGILQAMDLKDYRAAVATFTSALGLAEGAGDRPLIIHAHLYRGEAYIRSGQSGEATPDFRAAATEADAIGAKEEEWKAEYGLARAALLQGDRRRAMDLLKNAVRRIESLRVGLTSSSLRSAFLADKRDPYDLLIENGADVESTFARMEQSRARRLLDSAHIQPRRSLREVTGSLPPHTALLEYWIGERSGAVVWADQSGSGRHRFTITPEQKQMLAEVPRLLSDPSRTDWENALRPVAGMLLSEIAPLRDPQVRRLIIIPDGLLSSVPFDALPFDKGLMTERFAISYLPASSLVTSTPVHRQIRWFWQTSLKAFADPAPGEGAKAELADRAELPRLPAARDEIAAIASAVGGRSQLYSGQSALKTQLLAESDARILHLATHAFADFERPELSFVLLAPPSASQRYDYLFLKEIGDLPLRKVQLVTLSACQGATAKDSPGEGVQSFSSAFLSAGVPTVVTSLWAVPDRATSELMIRFYRNAASGQSYAEAMRSARLDFIRSPKSRHPANWAAFIVSGDGDARLPYIVGLQWMLLPVCMTAALILALRRLRKHVTRAAPIHSS
jgi:CHAT domain-containing protein